MAADILAPITIQLYGTWPIPSAVSGTVEARFLVSGGRDLIKRANVSL